jgi:hypothetical protein
MAPSPIASFGAFIPRLLRLRSTSRQLWVLSAHPVLDCQEPLLATGGDANNYKGAELFILAPKAAVDTVGPDIDDWLVIERSVFPAVVFLGPFAPSRRAMPESW